MARQEERPTRVRVATGPKGEVANAELIEHSRRFERRLYRVTDAVHCLVGHGLANSSLVVGSEGAVVVDTGESIEDAEEHLAEFRKVTDAPVRAVVYSHFHYTRGTRAYLDRANGDLQVWAHERVPANTAEVAGEIGPAYARRLMIQFGAFLPETGPDAMPNYGIGPWFFRPGGGRTRPGYVPPTHTVGDHGEARICGMRFRFTQAPSDSDDTLIIELPDEGVVINNHVWPALFNVYTLRGEPYRDPLRHVEAIDRMRAMAPEHLVGVHGPPISGRGAVDRALCDYRDGLQYIWDQTVRGINRNLSPDELVGFVELPPHLAESPLCRPFYGEVPFHVRAIHDGLFGWFGNDAATLHPVPPAVESRRIVEGFGGREAVLAKVREALDAGETSWAAQLATHAIRLDPGDTEARGLKADALRRIGQHTTASNTRAFCLTQALELEGRVDPAAAAPVRPSEFAVRAAPPGRFVRALSAQLDPAKSAELDTTLAWRFADAGAAVALHVRRGVARFLDPAPDAPDLAISLTHACWARLLSGKLSLRAAIEAGEVEPVGSIAELEGFFELFDHARLRGERGG